MSAPQTPYAAHRPVMGREIVEALAPKDGGVYVDATFGGGGYARAILDAADCVVYGFDRDPTAVERAAGWAAEYGDRLKLINRPFAELEEGLAGHGVAQVDGVVFDLGVSSMQLDEAARGFSFLREGPLSMRMDGGRPDAADVVAGASAQDLAAIFRAYGEEKKAGPIARAIVRAREDCPIATTTALAGVVEQAAPPQFIKGRGAQKIHPATRVFQALRIFVNDELGQLMTGLFAAERLLREAGRLVVVTFHSLEDRIVKRFFASRIAARPAGSRHAPPREAPPATFSLLSSKALTPGEDEIAGNPRARSAKLRAGVRLAGPAAPATVEGLGAPRVAGLEGFGEGFLKGKAS